MPDDLLFFSLVVVMDLIVRLSRTTHFFLAEISLMSQLMPSDSPIKSVSSLTVTFFGYRRAGLNVEGSVCNLM